MSHGGRAAADDYGRAVSKVAVAQICETAGFHGVRESALDAFADIAIRYLIDLGKMAEFYANLAGRSQCNVFDVIRGLEDLEATQGFPGAGSSEIGQCLTGSGTVREIVNFVDSVGEEVPFAQPIPQFPVIKDRRIIPSFIQMNETPPTKQIPAWLPAFPDPHTYIHTPVWSERATDPREDKIEQARQRRKAERSLLSLQQRLLLCNGNGNGNGSAEASTSVVPASAAPGQDPGPGGIEKKNPFLRKPMPTQQGNKDVSSIALPSNSKRSDESGTFVDANHVSVLEAFAPAIEMLKSGLPDDDGKQGKTVLPAIRNTVHFKFRTGKKLIGESLDTRHQKKGVSRAASLAGREDERDDRKRRAEYILKQSTENPQELTLL